MATVTVCVSAAPWAPSESVARTDTVEDAGPSGNTHAKLVDVSDPATFVPRVPHEVTTSTVSSPGSKTENVYVCCADPSLTVRSLPGSSLAIGATLSTMKSWLAPTPLSPLESVAVTAIVVKAGPSANTQRNCDAVTEPSTSVPPAPQDALIEATG